MKQFIISNKMEQKSIYSVIQKQFPHLSLSSLNKVFRVKDVKVNDIRVNKDYIVKKDDVVKIYLTDTILFGLPQKIFYAYEDDNILIAYKPKGVVSNFEGTLSNKNTLVPYFDEIVKKEKGENLNICHRLDTNTEGLVIFSKNADSHAKILEAFKNNEIKKDYLALVYGKLPKAKDILSDYILKDPKTGYSKILSSQTKGSKSCVTEYKVIKFFKEKNCSVLDITLHTGRTHQIRAHMKHIGCPLIGDSKYSTNEINDKFKIYSQVLFATKYTFAINTSSTLNYLNEINIDITDAVLDKIQQLIYNI